jgi:hypothetical protein
LLLTSALVEVSTIAQVIVQRWDFAMIVMYKTADFLTSLITEAAKLGFPPKL